MVFLLYVFSSKMQVAAFYGGTTQNVAHTSLEILILD